MTIPAGTSDGPHTVYAVGSSGSSVGSASINVDTLPPVVGAATIQKSEGGLPGVIRPSGTYRVYAAITDPGSAITAATTNASAITAGATASALTAGTWTIAGVTYNYRSAQLTAGNKLHRGHADVHDRRDRLVRAQRDEQPLLGHDRHHPTDRILAHDHEQGGRYRRQGGDG